ncbi:MAG: dihydroorotase [Deltaproteobacteria bacterium]|nr:dihydroorotase [Deltaproteobacteria bacterium]
MYDVVFRSATVVIDGAVGTADVAVRDGRIERVAPSIGSPAAVEVPCEGLALLPGAVDLHVHLRDPGLTHKEDLASGTAAAVAAGVTTVLDMPNTRPPTVTAAALADKVETARRTAACDVRFFMALTRDNLDEVERAASIPGFAGVKVFLGSTTGDILLEGTAAIERALDRVPALFAFHAELESVLAAHRGDAGPEPDASSHHVLRPAEAVAEGARAVLALARPGRRLHLCHLSAAAEIELLAARAPGLTSEVSPHHLWLTCDDAPRLGNLIKVNPPVRTPADRDALRAALAAGTIDAVATDHAPHTIDEKALPYPAAPSGVPGLDTLVPAVLRLVQVGALSLPRAVSALCEAPARVASLPGKGRVAEGADADLALWDLAGTWTPSAATVRTRCRWTPFEGIPLASRPVGVWVAGRRVA